MESNALHRSTHCLAHIILQRSPDNRAVQGLHFLPNFFVFSVLTGFTKERILAFSLPSMVMRFFVIPSDLDPRGAWFVEDHMSSGKQQLLDMGASRVAAPRRKSSTGVLSPRLRFLYKTDSPGIVSTSDP
jgi:hypothetical protein